MKDLQCCRTYGNFARESHFGTGLEAGAPDLRFKVNGEVGGNKKD